MLLGLLVACIGIENPAGHARFTFGITDLLGGVEVIPALVGVFAVSEVMRAMTTPRAPAPGPAGASGRSSPANGR
jgi:TctA family transporter